MIVNIQPRFQFVYEGMQFNIYHANKGEGLPKHEHSYSHVTMCNSGSCLIRVEGKEVIMNKNAKPINLLSNKWHEIEALEDETVFVNIFADKVA